MLSPGLVGQPDPSPAVPVIGQHAFPSPFPGPCALSCQGALDCVPKQGSAANIGAVRAS